MILNGNFKSYVIANNTYELVEATSTKTAYALFPNWYVKKGNTSKSWAILSNGNSSYGTELVAGNQCAVFQQANTGGISFLELSQTINLQPGVYDIAFDNNYRKPLNTYYATTHKMYVEVSNASETALIKTEVPIGSTWQTRTYRFNVTTQNNFELIFTSYDSNSTLYSSIFLANVTLTLVSSLPVSTSSVSWVVGGRNSSGQAAIAYSSDGQTWTNASNAGTIFGTDLQYQSIAHNGNIWVAGSNSASICGYSYDANTWYASTSGKSILNSYCTGVAYGNDKFVAVGGGTSHGIMYSFDGITWIGCANSILFTNGYMMGVVYRNSIWVAYGGGSSTTRNIATSPDGITWTLASSTNFTEVGGIDWNGTNWVVCGASSPDSIRYTTNIAGALTGTGVGNCFGNRGRCVRWNGTKFIAGGVSNALIMTSADGVTWATVTSTRFASGTNNAGGILGIHFNNGIWLAAQTSSANGQSVLFSSDNGVNWTNTTTNVFPSGYAWAIASALPSTVYPCFKEGSKILTLDPDTDIESYVPVESLRPGDLIRTSQNGHKAIFHIGKKILPNPSDDPDERNRLYRFSKSKIPGMREDLCITGEHCTLHDNLSTSLEEKVRKHMGDIYITEYQYRVPACIDERAEPYTDKDAVTIWHFALENNNVYYNYGVYANGLLVESCSIQYLTELSNMELIE